MTIGPWEETVHPPGITYRVPELVLPAGARVWLAGDNGAGKTLFLERALLPRLTAAGHRVFLLAQDLPLQAHVLAATLAAMGRRAPRSLDALALEWCAAVGPEDVLLLDEADRHLQPNTMARLLALPAGLIVAVSHQARPCTATHCLAVRRHGPVAQVEVQP